MTPKEAYTLISGKSGNCEFNFEEFHKERAGCEL